MLGLNKLFSKGNKDDLNQKVFSGDPILNYPDSLFQGDDGFRKVNYNTASRDGFEKNYVVFRAITDIAESASQIPLVFDQPELEELLRKPYYKQGYTNFIQDALKYKLLGGNFYAEAITVGKKISMLRTIRPDRVDLEYGMRGGLNEQLIAYRWTQGGTKLFPVDEELKSEMFHSKLFNPQNEWLGMSLLQSAIISIDQSNAMSAYNKKVVENNGVPSMVLGMNMPKDNFIEPPSPEQMKAVRKDMEIAMGKGRSSNIAMLNWQYSVLSAGMAQQEMDWVNSKTTTAREIALALGYPPFLLGLAEGSTFNNVSEARMSLYDNTVIPMLSAFLSDLDIFFESITGKQSNTMIDRDNILALQPRVFEKRESARNDFQAGIISDIEARQEGNYPEEAEGEFFMPSSQVPKGMEFNLLDE